MGKYTDLVNTIAEDPREKKIREDAMQAVARGGRYSKLLAQLNVDDQLADRAGQRKAAQEADPAIANATKEMLQGYGRRNVLDVMRKLTPEQRAEALRIAPGVAQQMGDDRGGVAERALGAVRQGIYGISQPIMEMTGVGGTPEEIDYIRQLQASSQEFAPARPDDPWYARGALGAAEQVPFATTVVAGGGLGQVAGKMLARPLAARMATAAGMGRATLNAAGKAGQLAGITAAAFPSQYVQEVDQLKEIGMQDGPALRLLAGGTAAVTGLIEGIVPNPFKTGKVPLTEGAMKAARQYLWEAAKQAPGEMSEEYLQGVTSGLGKTIAGWLDENAEDKSIADAFSTGWEQAKEAALPMAFLLGVPAAGGASLSAMQAQRLTRLQQARSKGFVSTEDAKELGIAGSTRKERLANTDAEIEQLQTLATEAQGSGTSPEPTTLAEGMSNEGQTQEQTQQTQAQTQADGRQEGLLTAEEAARIAAERVAQRRAAQSQPPADTMSATNASESPAPQQSKGGDLTDPKLDKGQAASVVNTMEELEALPKHSIYTQDNMPGRFMVRSGNPRGGGDAIFGSQEEADRYATMERTREQEWAKAEQERQTREAQAAKKEAEYIASFQGFKADSPLTFGNARKLLEKKIKYNGKDVARKEAIEQEVAAGATIKRGWLQQDNLDIGLHESEIGKTGLLYAEHLISKRDEAKPQTQPPADTVSVAAPETKPQAPQDEYTAIRDRAVARVKKEVGYAVVPREAKDAEEQEQLDFLKSRGKQASFVDSDDRSFTGAVDKSTGFLLISGNRDTDDIWRTIGHELAHETGLDAVIPADSAELIEGRKKRLARAKGQYRKRLESDADLLDREARADIVGQFMRDKTFRDKLANDNPTLWERLRDAVLKIVGKWTPKDEAKRMVLEELRAAPKPQKKTGKKPATQENLSEDKKPSADTMSPKEIGVNKDGQKVFEDENGVRSVQDDNVQVREAAAMRPTRDKGVVPVVDADNRDEQFKSVDELKAADTMSPTAVREDGKAIENVQRADASAGQVAVRTFDNGISLTTQKDINGNVVPVTFYDGREIVHIVDEKGRGVWFYRSFTGTGGKQQGRWYPIGGLASNKSGTTGWIIKGDPVNDKGYGRPELAQLEDKVNEVLPSSDEEVDAFLKSISSSVSVENTKAPSYTMEPEKSGRYSQNEMSSILQGWKDNYLNRVWGNRSQTPETTDTVLVPAESSDADLEAMIEAEFDKQLGTKQPAKKRTGKKSPEAAKKRTGRKSKKLGAGDTFTDKKTGKQLTIDTVIHKNWGLAPVDKYDVALVNLNDGGWVDEIGNRKVILEKMVMAGMSNDSVPAPKTRIQKAADNARQEADDLWADLNKMSKDKFTKPTVGLDPELAALAVRVALAEIKANTLSFAAFVEQTVAKVPADMLEKLKPYMEMAWKIAHKRKMTDDPGGRFDDVLAKKPTSEKSDETRTGSDGNTRVEDGTRKPDGNAPTGSDRSDGVGATEGETGQPGDRILPDTRSTEKDERGGRSEGDGTDGRTDAGESEQGQGNTADTGTGSDDGAVADRLAVDHVIAPDDDIAVSSLTQSLARNINALEILKALEAEGRFPDEAERKALAQYTGWGGLSQALDSIKGERMLGDREWLRDPNWEKKWGKAYLKLKELLTKEEFEKAQNSTENAHYTSKPVIQSLWKIAERLGFKGGRVLELGAGIGHFAGLMPSNVRGSTKFIMVEMDSVSSRIAKMLYPNHEVFATDMAEFKSVPGSVTMGIGNVPFAGENIADANRRYGLDLNLHNYSFARHLDAVAPGGIVVAISTHNTMDANIKQRQFLATKGDLIGAIRLPNDAFAENAKTEVVTDILIFRRPRQGEPKLGVRIDQNADVTVKTKDGRDVVRSINKYFIDNPHMVLGTHSAKGSMYGADEYTVESTPGDLQAKIDAAIDSLPLNLIGEVEVADQVVSSDKTVPFGRLEIQDGKVVMGYGDKFVPLNGQKFEGFPVHLTGKTGVARARDYIELRDLLADVRRTMLDEDASDEDVKQTQQQLTESYDRYVKKHGPLNAGKTDIFVRDPDYYRVLSLENEKAEYNPQTKKIEVTYEKAAIFTQRVLGPQKEPTSAASPADAMSLSIAWRGAINSEFVGKLLGVSAKEAENKLLDEGLAFRNPSTTELELADLYLSGNVRTKLAQAKISADEDPQYRRNVEALEKVLPAPITLKKDTVRLGATWIPENVINAFASQAFGTNVNVTYNANTDAWTVSGVYGVSDAAKARYKTERVDPEEVLSEVLNLRSIKVYDKVETGEYTSAGKPRVTQVLNEKETQAAKHRASVMRADFEKWVMENPDVNQLLAKLYNDKYNNFVRTKYNGDFLVLPGANPEIKLRPYQKSAIWRILNRGTSLLAHAVGSGKTYTMIGAAMEMRRLGLARRPLLVVQNATLGQFATSFQKMYPNANILVASKDDLGKGKRQLFLNKISTGNWDAVVMAQSTFDNMASDPDVERAFIQDQLDLIEEAIREEGGESTKTPTVKQLVRQKKSLKKRFDKLIGSRAKKEDNVTFEELGADALFLDEAHAYKKPAFTTKLSQLVGLNTEPSARSLATTIKVRSIQNAHNGRNVILATGTPVTNTLGEAWHMVNYVSPATNAAFNSRTFDQFIANFAQVEPTLTMNAGGQYVYKDAIVKFRNGHQLVEYINDSWDIVTPDQLREYMETSGKGFPALRDGKLTAITVERTPGVANFMQYIERVYARYKAMPAKQRREMSFIPALAYGASKAATLDIRMVNPNAAEEKNSKLQRAADEIKRIYDESMATKGTQLFFSDMKNPFNMRRLHQFMGGETIDAFTEDDITDDAADEDTDTVSVDEDEAGSFLYQELKKKLLERGIPAEQIAFVSDAKTDSQRQVLFERVKNGDIRILIGSTAKMGVGVNVQDKLVALHHFDTPQLPADLEQREGRILRFGNQNAIVEILRYATKKTLDGAVYMATVRKQKFIWQVLNGQLDGDSFEDPSSATMLSVEEQLAAIQDDPIFFEKIEVQNRLRELELERQSFYDAQQRVASSLSSAKSNLKYNEDKRLPQLQERAERIQKLQDDGQLSNFVLKYNKQTITDVDKASEVIKARTEEIRSYILANSDSAKMFSQVDGGLLGMPASQTVQFMIGPTNVVIAAQPALVTERNEEGKDVTKLTVRFKSMAYLQEPDGIYIFYEGTANKLQTFFEKAQTILQDTKEGVVDTEKRIKSYEDQIVELERLLENQWEDQAEYDEKKARLAEIEQQMLSSKSSLGKDKPASEAEQKLAESLTRLGQYILPGMSDIVPDIDRQDFVRKYRDRAIDAFWGFSNDPNDAQEIQDAADMMSPLVTVLMGEIYAGKFKDIGEVYDSKAYGDIKVAASSTDMEERILSDVDNAVEPAMSYRPAQDDDTDGSDDTGVLYQTANVQPQLVVQATDIAIDAQDAGIETFDELVAFSVKTIGEQRTRAIGQYLTVAGNVVGLKGVRPTADVLGMPGVTREQAKTLAKAAFPMLSDEQIEAGLALQDITGFGRDEIGYAPFGTPVPSGNQEQSDADGVKGWTQFISATRAIIGATGKADVSTFIHEFLHPMRKFLLNRNVPAESRAGITDEDIQALEDYCGVKDGKWTVDTEEKAAKAWEQYWFEGKSPNTALKSLFEKLAKWMREVYRGVHQITGGQLPPEVRKLFDKIVQRGGVPADMMSVDEQLPDDGSLTSVKNEVMNELRVMRGLPELADVAAQTQQEWLDAAEVQMNADPLMADRLVKEINRNPRNLSNIEVAVLQLYYRQANNALSAASDRLFEAKDAGDTVSAAQAQTDTDGALELLAEIEDASKAAGREWGRAGVARQIVLRKDFSLAGLMRKARVANGGNALNKEQQAEIAELARKVAELEGKLAKAEQEKADLERKQRVDKGLEDEKKRTPPVKRSTARKKAADAVSAFKAKFADIFKPKQASTDTLQQTEDERMAEEAKAVVDAYVKAGVFSFGEFMANVKRDIGADLPEKARVAFATAWGDAVMLGEVPTPAVDRENLVGMTRLARQIQRSLVESGITDREEVLDAVHASLQEIEPDITRRETMDALSGYGQYSQLKPGEVEKIIRDINGQLQQLSKLEDMRAGQAPAKTGVERRTPSDEERRLTKLVNEAKRRGGFVVTDPAAQLRTAMDAAKTAVRNRITDLEYEINNRQRIVRNKTELTPDAELESLRQRRDALLEIHKGLFPKQPATMAQRIASANRALDAAIADIEQQIATGNVASKGKKQPISTPELDAKRARLKALQEQRKAMRDILNPKLTPEQRAERAYKANLLKRIADYQERMLKSEFDPPKRKEVRVLTPEQLALKKQLEDVKDQFFRKAADYRLANMSPLQKAWDYTKETAHLSRALMTSFDLSAVFRQGGVASFAHPKLAAETSREMLRALWSQQVEFDIAEQMRNNPMYQFAITAGLSITEDEGKITRQEEAYMGRWTRHGIGKEGSKINKVSRFALAPVAASARAYTTFLNGMRFRLFEYMVNNLGKGGQVTADEAKVIAQYVNVATGRADLGKLNQTMANLNTVFFAPRYVASRFQYLAMPFYLPFSGKASYRVKKAIAMEYARYATGLAAFLGAAVVLGSLLFDDDDEKPTVELDPRSSDFGKIKIGETRIDPLSGFSQTVAFVSQVGSGKKKGLSGEIQHLRGEEHKYGQPTTWDVMADFGRKKLAPIPSTGVNLFTGENVIGEKVTPLTAARGLFIPLSLSEVKETMQARGVPVGLAVGILSVLGMSGGTYGPKTKYANATESERAEQFAKDLKAMQWDSPDPAYSEFLTAEQYAQVQARREERKQGLAYAALANPIHNKGQSDESYQKEVAERDKALESLKKAGWTAEQTRQLLIDYWKSNRERKESVADRLRRISRVLGK